ncbi:MAG TPA: hypothetical protein VKC35_17325 [Vicinamibacterales bacterium]|nr:hypothetical protein [Vicinamibacterales bacterium]
MTHTAKRTRCALAVALTLAVAPLRAIESTIFETAVRGYPVMRDAGGRRIADGNFVQWIEKDRLHVQITYTGNGRQIEETIVLRQRPELVQEAWRWSELERGKPVRTFDVNLLTGAATATKLEKGEMKRWADTLHVERGTTFAGFGFTMAAKALRERMVKGETVELKAVGFTPAPKVVTVAMSWAGREDVRMSGRGIAADHFIVHPKVPAIAKLFVKVPDAHIWLTTPPAGFLRYEGALAEPSDAMIRIDLLPGEPSEAARPVATSGKK